MSTFDIKKFLIKEGMTRVSRDRKRLLKESNSQKSWVDSASYDEMVDWIIEYLGDIALSLGYDWDPSRNLRFNSDNGWWFEAEEGPTEDSPFADVWLPEDETDPESNATLLKYYKNDVEALRTLIKNVDWDTLTVTGEISKDHNEAVRSNTSEGEMLDIFKKEGTLIKVQNGKVIVNRNDPPGNSSFIDSLQEYVSEYDMPDGTYSLLNIDPYYKLADERAENNEEGWEIADDLLNFATYTFSIGSDEENYAILKI